MRFQTIRWGAKLWWIGIDVDSRRCEDLNGINIVFTDTLEWYYFGESCYKSFLQLNTLSEDGDAQEFEEVIRALSKMRAGLKMAISETNQVTIEVHRENVFTLVMIMDEIRMVVPISKAPTQVALKTLGEIQRITLEMACYKSQQLDVFVREHSEKRQSLEKLVNKLNTRYQKDPWENGAVKDALDLPGSHLHWKHAQKTSEEIMAETRTAGDIHQLFAQHQSDSWNLICPPEEEAESIKVAASMLPTVPLEMLRPGT